ncbi:hypothetical protein HS088_TW22G00103 [Tripterygium wilfordii]|uniref:Methyltransferase type 11 domain-containing protein n=1 Tax=Tripterygium wilfordii TaxID=458696 RepID=A0A7J7BXJ8_TRIWF|nr:uncharacterized protein LOC119990758 [Tripterygium wilfordii]KAF5726425.1 hypothetical protein HS088_TW22G00103 [Tripterygium wilfordii]
MEKHIESLLNKFSIAAITIATFTLLIVALQTPETCIPPNTPPKPHLRFPKSSCDSSPRQHLPLHKKNLRLWSSKSWQTRVSSYFQFFTNLHHLDLLHNHSRAICVSAGAGHEVMALRNMGLTDVTGVELVDSPPLVKRADPHNLPYFDGVFDFAFSGHFEEALFPGRYAAEMERTLRVGGVCVVVVDASGDTEVTEISGLFKNSKVVRVENITLIGSKMTGIIFRRAKTT